MQEALFTENIITEKNFYLFIKRYFDILISIIGIIILIPIAFIIKIIFLLNKDYNSILYKQNRIGKNGKIIKIYKFRTMIPDAENYKFTDIQKKEFLENYKLENDPRITKIGNFLRKTSLDELPQFINIFKGEMSLVGPRPVILNELEKYGDMKKLFLSITPGLTGYWQANGRSNTTYDERIKMELYYINNCSLLLDIKIIFKTIIVVLKKEGAK